MKRGILLATIVSSIAGAGCSAPSTNEAAPTAPPQGSVLRSVPVRILYFAQGGMNVAGPQLGPYPIDVDWDDPAAVAEVPDVRTRDYGMRCAAFGFIGRATGRIAERDGQPVLQLAQLKVERSMNDQERSAWLSDFPVPAMGPEDLCSW